MSIDDTGVVARLRAGADQVERHEFDAGQVIAGSRRALRRRRTWQALGSGATAAAVAFSLALAGPVPVPGGGEMTLPGSEQIRELFGLAEASEVTEPAEAAGCAAPDPAVQRTLDMEPVPGLRRAITFNLTDARRISACFDVRTDEVHPDSFLKPETLTDEGALWWVSPTETDDDLNLTYHALGSNHGQGVGISGENVQISNLVAEGRKSAWFESSGATAEELLNAPFVLRTSTSAGGSAVTIGEVPRWGSSDLAITDERVAWHVGGTAYIAPLDGSGAPEPVAHEVMAIGSDDDEIVVATSTVTEPGSSRTTFTSYGDDGSTTTLLEIDLPGFVQSVDLTDDVLTYALDYGDFFALPRVGGTVDPAADGSVRVRLNPNVVDGLAAAGDSVAWVVGPVAYLLRDVGATSRRGPDLIRIGQTEHEDRMTIGLAGDHIAWSESSPQGVLTNVGTLLDPDAAVPTDD
ncbi:hypothetical protein [Promicromonospora sukumoe]